MACKRALGSRISEGNTYWISSTASFRLAFSLLGLATCFVASTAQALGDERPIASFAEDVQPVLEKYCYGCHGLGSKKGGVTLDEFPDEKSPQSAAKVWFAVLKNVRSNIMPPAEKPQPTAEERSLLEGWIKYSALAIDPTNPDPGRVTVRRLNRVEYRNTIKDLLGVEFDVNGEFPQDDTGHGFDNNGDVLTLSPLLLEKYFAAASAIVAKAVPTTSKVPRERVIPGRSFRKEGGAGDEPGAVSLSYYETSKASTNVEVEHDGEYRLLLNLTANERYVDGQNDYNRCRLRLLADGEELLASEFGRLDNKPLNFEFDRVWKAGSHTLTVETQPLTPDQKQVRSLAIRIQSATLRGPMDQRFWIRPADYAAILPRGSA